MKLQPSTGGDYPLPTTYNENQCNQVTAPDPPARQFAQTVQIGLEYLTTSCLIGREYFDFGAISATRLESLGTCPDNSGRHTDTKSRNRNHRRWETIRVWLFTTNGGCCHGN